jgi:hypothetical protein
VTPRLRLVLAILVYVTLDLSLASMPGAFVFAAADSVESPHGGRGRSAVDIVMRVVAADASVSSPAHDVPSPPAAMTPEAPRERAMPRCLPRAALETATPSEDPH